MGSAAGTWAAIAPVLPVGDVARSAAFYCRYLGFEATHFESDGSYAVVCNAGQSLHLTRADSEQALRAARENISFVVAVSDLDALWHAVSAGDPPVRVRAPEMKPWGLREFHMYDLDGCLLRFQERLGAAGGRS